MNKQLASSITIDMNVVRANHGAATSSNTKQRHIDMLVAQAYTLDKRAKSELRSTSMTNSSHRGLIALMHRLAGYGVDVEAMGATVINKLAA